MCEGEGGRRRRKSWWLGLQSATSPDCVTAGDQHPSGRGAAVEGFSWFTRREERRRGGGAGRRLTTLPSSAGGTLSQRRSDDVLKSTRAVTNHQHLTWINCFLSLLSSLYWPNRLSFKCAKESLHLPSENLDLKWVFYNLMEGVNRCIMGNVGLCVFWWYFSVFCVNFGF